MADETLALIRQVKGTAKVTTGEKREPVMHYLPVGLTAEFKAYVGFGNASKVVESLIREGLTAWEKAGLISKDDRKRMDLAREAALNKARRAKGSK